MKFETIGNEQLYGIDGGITLEEYELAVLGVTTTVGIIASAACPVAGAGVIILGWAMCLEAEGH